MIKKTNKGYQVVSESGKPLSEPDMPYKQAQDRLSEVEFFKRVKQAKGDDKKKQGQNDPKTIEEMQKRYDFQQNKYKDKEPVKMPDKMNEYELDKLKNNLNKNETKPQTKQSELPPVKRFENLKSKLNPRHQKALDKVLGK